MSTDPIQKALALPNGARFYRCALQVNPHHYAGTYRGAPNDGDEKSYAKAILDKAVELGIEVLAITDHHDVNGVVAFRDAAVGSGVHVFPGFELTSREGIQVLCIYPQETKDESLGRFLGQLGITSATSPIADKPFTEVLEIVRIQGGVTVAAHATNEHGLLKVLTGQACIEAWRHNELLAIQIPGPIDDLPHNLRQIVENKNADYRREHSAGERQAVAVVNAKDVAKPDDLEDRAATCWIKMSDVGIEALRQAFLDPDSRIRLNPKDGPREEEAHSELVAIAWEGGFLDGAAVHFNSDLNVLVGGRGTGKSTVIESIRSVLGLDAIGDEARTAHEGIVRHVLKSGTKISLEVKVCRPAPRRYRIERTIPNPSIVRDENGSVSNLAPRDVLARTEVYGQHEIAEVAKSREKRTRLLDRFMDRDDARVRRKADLQRELERSRKSLLDVRAEVGRIAERLAALPGLEETLHRFREAGLEEKLKEQSLLVREERLLASIPERLAPFGGCVENLKAATPIDRAFLSQRALADLPGREILSRANEVLDRLDRDLQRIVKDLEKALASADQGLAAIQTDWEARKELVQTAYEKILRELQKSRVDGEEFIRLRRQIEELRPLRDRQAQATRLEKEHADRRRSLLAEWEDFKAEEFRRLDRAAKKVGQALRDKVQIEVRSAGDREPLAQVLRSIGGRLSEAIDTLKAVPELSLPKLVEACRAGASEVAKTYGIPPAQAERLAKADPEVLMRIEELELPPVTSIRLNTAAVDEPANWQTLEDLSTGQKATAVLLLLLLESDAPLIVDQPEDDLDNRFITEGILPRMREEKQRRQFLFSTHNANIPVLGDAELIVGLSASGEADRGHARLAAEHMGSIDDGPVRVLVEEILEGGKDAFERRRRKYGF